MEEECVYATPDIYGGTSSCDRMYNCCDCGAEEGDMGCGCPYCWSCNACDVCRNEE